MKGIEVTFIQNMFSSTFVIRKNMSALGANGGRR